jgi:hypothetical protein
VAVYSQYWEIKIEGKETKMKKSLVLLQLALVLVLGACGKDSTTPQTGSTPGAGGVTWTDAEKKDYLSTCPFGEKQCGCVVTVFQQKGITAAKVQEDPSLTGTAVSSPEFSACMK